MAEQKAAQRYAAAVRIGNEHREALEISRKAEMVGQAKLVELERALMRSESALLKQGTIEAQVRECVRECVSEGVSDKHVYSCWQEREREREEPRSTSISLSCPQ